MTIKATNEQNLQKGHVVQGAAPEGDALCPGDPTKAAGGIVERRGKKGGASTDGQFLIN